MENLVNLNLDVSKFLIQNQKQTFVECLSSLDQKHSTSDYYLSLLIGLDHDKVFKFEDSDRRVLGRILGKVLPIKVL